MKRLLFALCLCLLFGTPRRALGHDLSVDQLTLWPEPAAGVLRGQVLFDPLLTRPRGAPADEAARARVLGFLGSNLRVEVDGAEVPLRFEVRELWTGDGAIQGDSVMLRGSMPSTARELRVAIGSPLRALAVSVEMPDARGSLVPRTVLVLGGQSTPPYRLGSAQPGEHWIRGGPEELPLGAIQHGFAEESHARIGGRYVVLGIEHILPNGWDHVLFVAGLVLGSRGRRRFLLWQLAGFTLAHTLTLGLGALGLVLLPARVIEPLIALSIAFLGIENLLTRGAPKHRLPWVLGFGLLHGQGFASALLATGIPPGSLVLALFSFNVGVELGQLVVVALLLLLLSRLKTTESFCRYALRPGSIVIGAAGLLWTAQRIFWR